MTKEEYKKQYLKLSNPPKVTWLLFLLTPTLFLLQDHGLRIKICIGILGFSLVYTLILYFISYKAEYIKIRRKNSKQIEELTGETAQKESINGAIYMTVLISLFIAAFYYFLMKLY